MKPVFVIGNGCSRSVFDLALLQGRGETYGCNLLIKDTTLDNTIVCDRAMLVYLSSQGYDKTTTVWTRQRWLEQVEIDSAKALPMPIANPVERWDKEMHWGAGTHAVNLAAHRGAEVVVMIGFDLWAREDGLNNIYKDIEPFYENDQIAPDCWVYQLSSAFKKYPNTTFVQIQPQSWKDPIEWADIENFTRDDFQGLREWLKEL
jgi:hypothetical protein